MLQVKKLTACRTLILTALLVISATASVHGQNASRQAPLAALPDFTGLSEKLAPAVVNISVTTAAPQSPPSSAPRRSATTL